MSKTKQATAVALVFCALAVASYDYTVQRGDTLGEIAEEHGVGLRALVDANDIADPDLIRPGQVLVIPGSDGSSAGSSNTTYEVAAGDTLAKIARRFKVSLSSLIDANDITNPNLIRPGQVLVIPGSSSGGGSGAGGSVVASHTTYVVQRGDSLGKIAGKFGVSVSSIVEANGLANPNLIMPGQKLIVDADAPAAEKPKLSMEVWIAPGAGEVAAEAYTVRAGDSLAKIAEQYGVSISSLIEANNLSNPDLLKVGQVLSVPLGEGWVCPVPGGGFGDTWGAPRPGGRLHKGTDIFAPQGTPILAPVPGYVTIQTGSLAGIQFTLEGDDGHVYYGTHLLESAATGRVVAGEVIGRVGNTGNAINTPHHLHFETHPNDGEPVNPYHTLMKACR